MVFKCIILENCRLCQNKPGKFDLNADKKLQKDIFECLKIKITDKWRDFLPKSICGECESTIKQFANYKRQTQQINLQLQQILRKSDTDRSQDVVSSELKPFNGDESKGSIVDLSEEAECINVKVSKCKNTSVVEVEIDAQEKKFICSWENCHKKCSSAYTLKTHELKHEGKRSFLCVICGKRFITKNSLNCHEKIHLTVKDYTCKLCNIQFSVRSNLRAHEKRHHEGVKFYCSQCSKEFVTKCSLERHERIHIGIKEFQCETCPSAFYTNKELVKHRRYHQGLRPHKCGECFKTFFERHHLIAHVRSHTGEKPYVCKIPDCGKAFSERQKLKRHHNAIHSQISYVLGL